jgi:hypothetical protein
MPTLYARTLKRAAEIAGGTEALAVRLKIVPSHLTLWILGAEPTPQKLSSRPSTSFPSTTARRISLTKQPQVFYDDIDGA